MALAVLNLSPTANLTSSSRVLGHREWRSISDAVELRQQAAAALAHAAEHARVAAAEARRQQIELIEQRLQRGALLRALSLQYEFEQLRKELHGRFVDTVMTCLGAMLMPPPPAFFARVQASAASMIGEAPEVTLHVATADEAAARAGLEAGAGPVRIVVDPDLATGQCFLDTRFGRIQAGLPTQLEALRQALARWWTNETTAVPPGALPVIEPAPT